MGYTARFARDTDKVIRIAKRIGQVVALQVVGTPIESLPDYQSLIVERSALFVGRASALLDAAAKLKN